MLQTEEIVFLLFAHSFISFLPLLPSHPSWLAFSFFSSFSLFFNTDNWKTHSGNPLSLQKALNSDSKIVQPFFQSIIHHPKLLLLTATLNKMSDAA